MKGTLPVLVTDGVNREETSIVYEVRVTKERNNNQ